MCIYNVSVTFSHIFMVQLPLPVTWKHLFDSTELEQTLFMLFVSVAVNYFRFSNTLLRYNSYKTLVFLVTCRELTYSMFTCFIYNVDCSL